MILACGSVKYIGANIFIADGRPANSTSAAARINAFKKTGSPLWVNIPNLPQLCLGDDARRFVSNLVMGADGNVYVVAHGSPVCARRTASLVSYNGSTGALRFNMPLNLLTSEVPVLMPHKKGIVVRADSVLRYFDYTGRALPNITNPLPNTQAAVVPLNGSFYNSEGTSQTVDGRVLAIEIDNSGVECAGWKLAALNAYDPSGLTWRTTLSGRCVNTAKVNATPAGGAVVVSSGTAMAGQVVGLTDVAAYDLRGNQVWSTLMPHPAWGSDISKPYMDKFLGVDVNGNVILERIYVRDIDYDNYQYFVLDSVTGQIKLTLDTAELAAGKVYYPEFSSSAFGDGKVYAKLYSCATRPYGTCPDEEFLYALSVPGVGIDYPRGALFSTSSQSKVKTFNAIGDSFISGEGDRNNGFLGDACHRSTSAWPVRANNDVSLTLTMTAFSACSGATTKDILLGGVSQPKQIDQVKPNTEVVALSIGGNDAGFSNLIMACILIDCKVAQSATEQRITKLGNSTVLPATYKAIRQKVGPTPDIYVMGYPYVLPNAQCSAANVGIDAFITLVKSGGTGTLLARSIVEEANISWDEVLKNVNASAFTFSATEAAVAKTITDKLNAKISAVVKSLNDPHLRFVPANYTGSPFVGHTLCSTDPYFNGFYLNFNDPLSLPGDIKMSFHPNNKGTQAYEQVFADYYKKIPF